MFCRNCGQEINDNADVCLKCGSIVNKDAVLKQAQKNETNDSGSAGWSFLGFFFPLIAFILFLVWRKDKPKNARAVGIGALISVILSVVSSIILVVITMAVGGTATNMNIIA